MRLVQDHGFRTRQEIAEALVLQRKIREQQVVIHDDDVGCWALRRARTRGSARIGDLCSQAISRVEVICGHAADCSAIREFERSPALSSRPIAKRAQDAGDPGCP